MLSFIVYGKWLAYCSGINENIQENRLLDPMSCGGKNVFKSLKASDTRRNMWLILFAGELGTLCSIAKLLYVKYDQKQRIIIRLC